MAVSIVVSVVNGGGVVDKVKPGRVLPASAAVSKTLVVANIVDVEAASASSFTGSTTGNAVINYNDPGAAGRDRLTVTETRAAVQSAMNA